MMFLRILTFMMWNVRKEYFINLSKCHMKWWRNIRKLIYQCHKYFMGIFFFKVVDFNYDPIYGIADYYLFPKK